MNNQKFIYPFILKTLILILLLLDISYSYNQNSGSLIDGDVPNIVNPAPIYQKVLNDPLGISVLKDHQKYGATNRFSCHFMMRIWFLQVRDFFDLFFKDKIKCLYFTAAIFSTLVQLLITMLIGFFVCKSLKINSLKFIATCLIIAPFFQTNGFDSQIGIIDQCITYTFFYAFSLALLLLYFLPFYIIEDRKINFSKKQSLLFIAFVIFFSLFLSLSSPLVAPLVLLICPTVLISFFIKNWKNKASDSIFKNTLNTLKSIPIHLSISFVLFILFCLYSFYLGTFNIENGEKIDLTKRYALLFKGIPSYFFSKIGLPLIFIFLILNFFINKKITPNFKIATTTKLIIALSIVYLFLLPLGGYRAYRPFILRNDTFLPITFVLIFYVAKTSINLLYSLKGIHFKQYFTILVLFLSVFWFVDVPQFNKNECQKANLYALRDSENNIVEINSDCTLLSWILIKDPSWGSNISDLLYRWKITSKRKEFINK